MFWENDGLKFKWKVCERPAVTYMEKTIWPAVPMPVAPMMAIPVCEKCLIKSREVTEEEYVLQKVMT